MRLVVAHRAEDIFAKVAAYVQRHAPSVEVIWQGTMEPSKTPLDSPFTAPIKTGVEAAQT
jgi:hypothetical protein